jgi:copper chaperone CopZ
LIEEGVQNQIAVTGTLAAIGTAVQFYQVAKPIIEGVAKVWKNVVWGDHVTVRTIDPQKIDSAFNDSKVFIAEIKKRFPQSYAVIYKARQDMKMYQFDLSNIVQDLKLMTDSTARGVERSQRTLGLRRKMLTNKTITSEKDLKVWNMTIKSQVNELTDSIEKCDAIIKALEDLQKNTKKCKDTLDEAIDTLRKTLEASNK